MVIVLFLVSLVITGLVLAFVPSRELEANTEQDYHFVPFAGDAFGA